MTDENNLGEELAAFEKHRPEWVRTNPGDFVVILGSKVVGFYPDYESAFGAGLAVAGLGNSFLVKQVWAEDPAYLLY
jgi:hypothetical protein